MAKKPRPKNHRAGSSSSVPPREPETSGVRKEIDFKVVVNTATSEQVMAAINEGRHLVEVALSRKEPVVIIRIDHLTVLTGLAASWTTLPTKPKFVTKEYTPVFSDNRWYCGKCKTANFELPPRVCTQCGLEYISQ